MGWRRDGPRLLPELRASAERGSEKRQRLRHHLRPVPAAYVDARNEFVKQDDANGELQARIGEEITTEGGNTMTVQSGQKLSFDGQGTFETPEEIADGLNAVEDAQDEAGAPRRFPITGGR